MTRLKHEGLWKDRTKRDAGNPAEATAAKAWKDQNDVCETLLWLLDPDGKSPPTQRDATVAATVIQWIASPVGRSFLCEDLINKCPELREYVRATCKFNK